MIRIQEKLEKRYRRKNRVRTIVKGASSCLRFSIFRSNRHISAQIIDDVNGRTLISASDAEFAKYNNESPGRMERAGLMGQSLAEKARSKQISAVKFDRGRYRYHGLVAAVADGARKGGLKF